MCALIVWVSAFTLVRRWAFRRDSEISEQVTVVTLVSILGESRRNTPIHRQRSTEILPCPVTSISLAGSEEVPFLFAPHMLKTKMMPETNVGVGTYLTTITSV